MENFYNIELKVKYKELNSYLISELKKNDVIIKREIENLMYDGDPYEEIHQLIYFKNNNYKLIPFIGNYKCQKRSIKDRILEKPEKYYITDVITKKYIVGIVEPNYYFYGSPEYDYKHQKERRKKEEFENKYDTGKLPLGNYLSIGYEVNISYFAENLKNLSAEDIKTCERGIKALENIIPAKIEEYYYKKCEEEEIIKQQIKSDYEYVKKYRK